MREAGRCSGYMPLSGTASGRPLTINSVSRRGHRQILLATFFEPKTAFPQLISPFQATRRRNLRLVVASGRLRRRQGHIGGAERDLQPGPAARAARSDKRRLVLLRARSCRIGHCRRRGHRPGSRRQAPPLVGSGRDPPERRSQRSRWHDLREKLSPRAALPRKITPGTVSAGRPRRTNVLATASSDTFSRVAAASPAARRSLLKSAAAAATRGRAPITPDNWTVQIGGYSPLASN